MAVKIKERGGAAVKEHRGLGALFDELNARFFKRRLPRCRVVLKPRTCADGNQEPRGVSTKPEISRGNSRVGQ
jgi:hypothetical protein